MFHENYNCVIFDSYFIVNISLHAWKYNKSQLAYTVITKNLYIKMKQT